MRWYAADTLKPLSRDKMNLAADIVEVATLRDKLLRDRDEKIERLSQLFEQERNVSDTQALLIERLTTERDALKADAERYRFIRDGNAYIEPNHYDEDGIVTKEMYMAMETGKYYKDMRDFDMDIDEGITAIAKENKT